MAITTVLQGSNAKLKRVKIKSDVIGPGGTPLYKGQTYDVPEADAYTLRTGEQADIVAVEEAAAPAKPAAK